MMGRGTYLGGHTLVPWNWMSGPLKLSAKAQKPRAKQNARANAKRKALQKINELANREKYDRVPWSGVRAASLS
jgi:hypothetical protein